jgi:2-aminobenzoate-CoA ligase
MRAPRPVTPASAALASVVRSTAGRPQHTAHADPFAHEHQPTAEQWPELVFEGEALQFPDRLNAAVALLVDAVEQRGWGERRCILAPAGFAWTYAELLARARRIAQVLVHDLGLVSGNRVLLRAPNNPMMAACWFGVALAGGIAVATMPLLRARELVTIVRKARISHALCDAALAGELDAAIAQLRADEAQTQSNTAPITNVLLRHCLTFHSRGQADQPGAQLEALMARHDGHGKGLDAFDALATDTVLIAFTSGTTGQPKGTLHSHRDLLAACACWPREVLKASADDLFTGSPPLAFTFGLGGLLLFPLAIGAATLLVEQPSPAQLLSAIAEAGASVLFTAPTSYRAMAARAGEAGVSAAQGGPLRRCVSAGEVLPASTRALWKQHTGIELIDGIGATEMLHIFISHDEAHARPGATGTVVPGYQACVLGEDGRPLPSGQIGRLAVQGPTGCRYLADERQRIYVQGGWNLTGDAYWQDADGTFHYKARTDDMIVSAGYNIGAPEVEDALMSHPAVAECAVIGAPDPQRGQLVKAYVVLRAGQAPSALMIKALQDHVKQAIAPYKYPRAIAFLTALPRTDTGKLQRFRLKTGEVAAQEIPLATG